MPKYNRSYRVGEQIKRILATVISRQMHDKQLKLMNITAVKLSADLSVARIYISSFDDCKNRTIMLKILNESAGFLRFCLSKQLTTRRTPSLYFVYDESIEYANKMESLLDTLNLDNQ